MNQYGYLITKNIDIINTKIKFSTESDYNINRFSKLLSNLNIDHDIEVNGKVFIIKLDKKDVEFLINTENSQKISLKEDVIEEALKKQEYQKAIIRGLFMGAGSINNPDNKYHLEIVLSTKDNLKVAQELLQGLGVLVKTMQSNNRYSIYIKEGEEISKFLALIEANKAVLKFEDIRIKKEMRGKVNRIVNCETANLNKTINASIEQIAAIEKIKKKGKFNKLDDNLKEIATLRLENPDMSLVELGKLLKNPIGKSGVNYRLKKIMEIANEL